MREHATTTRVRYGETDQMGVVYHANHLLYFEMGRTELMRAAGLPYSVLEDRGILLVVTEAACRYRSYAVYDETLRIETRVARIGKASIRFEYRVFASGGRLVSEGHTELAVVDREKKPVRLPADVVALLS